MTVISNLFQAVSPLPVDFSSLLIGPPSSPSFSAPVAELHVLFPKYNVHYVSSPLRIPLTPLVSQVHTLSLHIQILQDLDSYLPIFLFWITTLSHLPISYKCHICSFNYYPSNVELAHCLTPLASAYHTLPILQYPVQMFLFCLEASPNFPHFSLHW